VSAKTEQEDRRRRVHRLSTVFFAFCFVFPREQRAPSSIDPSVCKISDSCLSANPCQRGFHRQVHQETEEW
jgi:hypothetical protein